ncbi:LysR substrate-binding domain-containing protein [Hyalangium minutum]|uniref:Transcriptional regulator, LysR family protein n=1 Tax=Hyalangium minutum TaxID=394096 RepID=A0A085WF57_9BACT|nr:LysR substrate-binding domain-containing protein [Hyalangium minutum]KFE66320.1 Transcriptional regulator, LysR family protein [Hyalangium minutum]
MSTLLAQGRLVRALEDWCPSYPGFFLYYPSRRQIPTALRAFVDFVKASASSGDRRSLGLVVDYTQGC